MAKEPLSDVQFWSAVGKMVLSEQFKVYGLSRAARENRIVAFQYTDAEGNRSVRSFLPAGFKAAADESQLILMGHSLDKLRLGSVEKQDTIRTFRVERISRLKIGDTVSELGSADPNFAGGTGFRYMLVEDQKLSIGLDTAFSHGDSEFTIYFQVGDWLAN